MTTINTTNAKSTVVPMPPQRSVEIEMETARRLSAKFGQITSSRTGEYLLADGNPAPDEIVTQVRDEILADLNRGDVRRETAFRILQATRGFATQVNILMWLTTAKRKSPSDTEMARKLVEWIADMRKTGKRLRSDPTFRDDSHWPPPPEGIREFIDRF